MKTSFYVSRGTFRQNIVFEKKIQRIRVFSRDISDFWRDSLSWILNLPSTCPEEPLRGTKIGEIKDISNRFLGLGRVCVEILAEKLQQSFQNCILRIQSMNSRKKFLQFWTSSKNFSDNWLPFLAGLTSCLLRLQKWFMRERVFFRIQNIFSIIFWLWVDDSPAFGEKKPGGSSKPHSTCAEEQFGKKLFLKENNFFIFGFLAVNSRIYIRKIWLGCQTCRRHLQKNKRREQNMEKER